MMEGFGRDKINGMIYCGEYSNCQRNGHGVLSSRACQCYYDGSFRNMLKHGSGEEIRPNISNHKGLFRNNVKDGYGQMRLANGSSLQGTWRDN